jgi:hypothetical protein
LLTCQYNVSQWIFLFHSAFGGKSKEVKTEYRSQESEVRREKKRQKSEGRRGKTGVREERKKRIQKSGVRIQN